MNDHLWNATLAKRIHELERRIDLLRQERRRYRDQADYWRARAGVANRRAKR